MSLHTHTEIHRYRLCILACKGSSYQELGVMEVFLEVVRSFTKMLPSFAGRELNAYSLPQQACCNQHHHDRDCAKDDRSEPSAEAAAEGPGHSALWASSL